MDPWQDHPNTEDTARCPDLNVQNRLMSHKIHRYVSGFPHLLVSCEEQFPVTEIFADVRNVHYEVDQVVEYMLEHSLENIVYTGFHHGHCPVVRPTGASASKLQRFRRWVVRDLVGMLCYDDPDEQDQKTKEHAIMCYSQ